MGKLRDLHWMQRALELASKGLFTTRPNPMVGCVLVKNQQVVGEGWHQWAGQPHAEVHALRPAGDQARGSTAYVTLEPCAHHGRTGPCADALIAAGVVRVVAAMVDPDPRVAGQGLQRLQDAGIEVHSGVLEAQSRELNRGFLSRIERRRPWVRMKIAMSLDGKVALADGSSQWITGPAARAHGHQWRARAGVILTGVGTVIADGPHLTVRIGQQCAPTIPVIVDGRGRCPDNARLFSLHDRVWIAGPNPNAKVHPGVEWMAPDLSADSELDLVWLLGELARRGIGDVHVEAGPGLNSRLLKAGLVDEILLYQAGKQLGDSALAAFPGASPARIPDSEWALQEVKLLDGDSFGRWRRLN